MRKLSLLAAFVAAQVLLALLLGYAAIGAMRHSKTPAGLSYEGEDYSGMGFDEAAGALKSAIDGRIGTESATIAYRDLEFVFKYSEIELAADSAAIADEIAKKSALHYRHALFSAFTRTFRAELAPRLEFDGLKLKSKLVMIKDIIDAPPQNANIDMVGGRIVRTPSAEGVSMSVDGSYARLSEAFSARPFGLSAVAGAAAAAGDSAAAATTAQAAAQAGAESRQLDYEALQPDITDDMLSDIDALIAEASTPIPAGSDAGLLRRAAESIEKVWVPRYGMASEPFSLNRYLSDQNLVSEKNADECSQLATTLFIALLRAGVDIDAFDRQALPEAQAYCEAGFGTAAGGSGEDFLFTNTLGSNMVIFTSVRNGELLVQIAGGQNPDHPGPREVHSVERGGAAEIYIDGELRATVEPA